MAIMSTSQSFIKIAAITGSLFLSGKIAAHGLVTVPALLRSISEDDLPSRAIIQIWLRLYERGHAHSPKIAGLTSIAFAHAAWSANDQQASARTPVLLYSAAASLVVGIIPYTLVFMGKSNRKLLERAAEVCSSSSVSPEKCAEDLADQKSTEELLRYWGTLTSIRGLLPMIAGVFGILAMTHYE